MGFYIVRGDLFKQKVDAIVVPASREFELNGSIGKQLKEKCGKKLISELEQLKKIDITDAVITNAFNLSCKRIIHVANPKWKDGKSNEKENLRLTYINALDLVQDFELESVAFPLLSSGNCGFDPRDALKMAVKTISEYVEDNEIDAGLVINDDIYLNNIDFLKKYKVINDKCKPDVKYYIEKNRRNDDGWTEEEKIETKPDLKKFCERLENFKKLKKITRAVDVYSGVISKAAYDKIISGHSIPKKYTVVSLGINMGLDVYSINSLLAAIGEKLTYDLPRDAIIIEGIYNNYDVDGINKNLAYEHYPQLKTN